MRRLLPALLLALAVTACGSDAPSAQRDEAGAVATEGAVDPFDVKLGDCVDQPVSTTEQVEEVDSVKAVPCGSPHDGEVYAVFDLPDGDFPGSEEVSRAGEERCVTEFESFVGSTYEDSQYDITSLFPTKESWESKDDRPLLQRPPTLRWTRLSHTATGAPTRTRRPTSPPSDPRCTRHRPNRDRDMTANCWASPAGRDARRTHRNEGTALFVTLLRPGSGASTSRHRSSPSKS